MHDEDVYLRVYRALQSIEEIGTKKRSFVPRSTFGRIIAGIAVLLTLVTVIGVISHFASEPGAGARPATATVPKAPGIDRDSKPAASAKAPAKMPNSALEARKIPNKAPAVVSSPAVVPPDKSISKRLEPKSDSDHAILAKRLGSHSDQSLLESRNWDGVKNSDNVADFRAFLQRFPAGPHAQAAAEAIQQLQWSAVDKQNLSSLRAYLDQNQQSPYSAEARQRLAALVQARQARAEEDAWNSVDQGAEPAVRHFLAQYPNGSHATVAQELLRRYSQQEEARNLSLADDRAWMSVSSADRHSLEQYLNEFPSGKHSGQARQWLSEISSAAESREAGAVVATLKRYSDAWNAKDLADITALRPGVGRRVAKEELSSIRSIVMRIQPMSVPKIEGDRATVECIHQVKQVFDDGTEKDNPGIRMTYFLVKRGGNWLIADSR